MMTCLHDGEVRYVLARRPGYAVRSCAQCGRALAQCAIRSFPCVQHLAEAMEVWDERAALLEYDGGLAREEAERLAWDSVIEREGNTV
jgi:hypothetical protein